MEFFQTTQVSVYKRMWAAMSSWSSSVIVNSTEAGVRKVRHDKGKYAFLLESTMNDFHNQREPCNTIRVGDLLDFKGYGVATPIGSDLKDKIGFAVLNMLESGELTKLHKKWWYDKGECPQESEGKGGSLRSALTLSNVAGIFYILIAGLALGMLVTVIGFTFKLRVEQTKLKKARKTEYKSGRTSQLSCPVHRDLSEAAISTDSGALSKYTDIICSSSEPPSPTVTMHRSTPIILI
jgi:hypothetical protein